MIDGNLVLKKIVSFLVECEQSGIMPTSIIIGKTYYRVLCRDAPHLVEDRLFLSRDHGTMNIVVTDDDYLGVGLLFDEMELMENTIKELELKTC